MPETETDVVEHGPTVIQIAFTASGVVTTNEPAEADEPIEESE